MNKVCFIGNLASDVYFNIYEKNNRLTMVATVFVAVSQRISKKSNKKPSPNFIPVTAFNKLAEAMSENLHKGAKVGIYGRLQPKRWTDKAGNRRFDVGVIISRIDFLSPKSSSTGSEASNPPSRAK